ncbi:MAG: hypothetical protein CMF45_00920 [Legionellales bacterium]|nr:hypothetical protein [Legionellales bacterium]|tara:strand:- start:4494 stop:6041 length:1548 start_codon:yes stop_codon:yes gene_type:complete
MNGIFISESGSLNVFHDLAESIDQKIGLEKKGMLVSHRRNYEAFIKHRPSHHLNQYHLVKEWEITNDFKQEQIDIEFIKKQEQELNVNNFWEALIVDRRLMLGPKCTYFQDYNTRFNHDDLLKILQRSLKKMEKLFDDVQPDFVSSFICVTMSEYLAYLYAKSRGIPYLNIRTVRINNNMVYADHVSEPSTRIQKAYQANQLKDFPASITDQAIEVYQTIKHRAGTYEGITIQKKQSPTDVLIKLLKKIYRIHRVPHLITTELKIKHGNLRDIHDPGVIKPAFYEYLVKPILKIYIQSKLKKTYITANNLEHTNYCFFPLHLEPERVLLISARYFMNQIEVVRNIAQSLPTGMSLVVKEHPKGFGRHPLGYYKKLLNIPNVRLISPYTPSELIIQHSKLVSTIAGTVGWEAMLREKPVVIFGPTVYEFLPDNMVYKIQDLTNTSNHIKELLSNYTFDENSIIKYIAASLHESIPINFYSTLLARSNVVTVNSNTDWQLEIDKLTDYTVQSIKNHE